MFVWSWLTIFLSTLAGVELFRRWSLRRRLLDVPNERSSHSTPTPRGGGVMIVATTTIASVLYAFISGSTGSLPYLGAALIVAVVSFIDDVRPLSPFLRLIAHAVAAGIAVWFSGGVAPFELPYFGVVTPGFAAAPLAFAFVVWLTNAYNFMDGIDGIAAVQAIVAGFAWSATGIICGLPEIAFAGGALAAANAGFLVLNWQPAKIFMGDVGSAFLGFLFAVVPLYAASLAPARAGSFYIAGIIFVWFFMLDTLFTFVRRAMRGAKLWQAHREHFYQQLVVAGMSHSSVTIVYGTLTGILAIVGVTVLFAENRGVEWLVGCVLAVTTVPAIIFTLWMRTRVSL